jgi:hypothetical protein
MKKSIIRSAILTSFIGLLCASPLHAKVKIEGTVPVAGKSKSDYPSLAKISLQDAIGIASKESSGKIVEAVLEKETGFLVYEVEVLAADRSKKEFVIDAGTGKILHVKERAPKSVNGDDDEDND